MTGDPYRKHAASYDTFVEPFVAGVRKKSLGLHTPTSGSSVLDVGCGTGTNLIPYQTAGCRVCGIDLSPAMIVQAQKKLDSRADLRVGDASCMPYSNNRFDLIVAMFTLHEMPPQVRPEVIGEMMRVLKPHGRVLLVDYRIGPIRFPLGWLAKRVAYTFEMLAGGEHFRNYRDFMGRNGLPPLFATQPLAIKKQATAGRGNIALYLLGL